MKAAVTMSACALLVASALATWKDSKALAADSAANDASALQMRVRALEDRAEIEQLLMEYGRTLDARDFAAYSQLFASDGEWIGAQPFGALKGPAAIRARMEAKYNVAPGSFHLLTNAIISIQGERATALSKWDFVIPVDGRPVIFAAGRYDDTLIREHGHWKFSKRVVAAAFTAARPAAAPAAAPAAPKP